jgi:hypothetical protein
LYQCTLIQVSTFFLPVAQSLQNIIWTQIQALQSGGENGKKSSVSSAPPAKNKPSGGNLPGAPAPISMVPNSGSASAATGPAADNAQAALVILLAAQMQAQMGSNHPSLLGNPQMLATLQNRIRQQQGGTGQGPNTSAPNPSLLTLQAPSMASVPPSHYQFPQNLPDTRKVIHANGMKNGFMKPSTSQKVSFNLTVSYVYMFHIYCSVLCHCIY